MVGGEEERFRTQAARELLGSYESNLPLDSSHHGGTGMTALAGAHENQLPPNDTSTRRCSQDHDGIQFLSKCGSRGVDSPLEWLRVLVSGKAVRITVQENLWLALLGYEGGDHVHEMVLKGLQEGRLGKCHRRRKA